MCSSPPAKIRINGRITDKNLDKTFFLFFRPFSDFIFTEFFLSRWENKTWVCLYSQKTISKKLIEIKLLIRWKNTVLQNRENDEV